MNGGLDIGVQQVLGGDVAWHCENDAAPARILAHHWPGVPNLGDITAVDWSQVGPVDVLTGGFPCQDVSHAGRRQGLIRDGDGRTRSGLWGHMLRAIDTLRPSLVVAENVRGLLSATADSDVEPCPWCMGDAGASPMRALGAVLADLADVGYDAAWCGLRAADVGAPHGRFRVFILAWPAADAEGWRRGEGWAEPAGVQRGHDAAISGPEPLTLLRTPTAQLAVNGGSQHPDKRRDGGHGPTLADEIEHLLPTPAINDAQKRIIDRAEVESTSGCWLWTGWTNQAATPYGRLSVGGVKVYAHRASYEAFVGPIPDGHEIDHLCQSSLCVNPGHLEAVTPEENRDRVTQRRTHCKRGHEFTEENTYWVRPGARACRACRAWQDKVDKARRKGEEVPLLPTPACNDMGRAYTPDEWDAWTERMKAAHGNGNGHGASLSIEALRVADDQILSPATAMGAIDFGAYAPAIARWEAVLGRPAPDPTEPTGRDGSHRLSARFTEWLMGLPAGHVTDVPGPTRNARLKALGNGVVPAQAEAALRWLLDIKNMEAVA